MRSILILIPLLLVGCTLFKKTSKSTDVAIQRSNQHLESSQLLLKRVDKETQIFTYWNDSGAYQVQYIKEQIDQAKSGKVTAIAKDEEKRTIAIKKATPTFIWGLIGLLVFSIGWFIFNRLRK